MPPRLENIEVLPNMKILEVTMFPPGNDPIVIPGDKVIHVDGLRKIVITMGDKPDEMIQWHGFPLAVAVEPQQILGVTPKIEIASS